MPNFDRYQWLSFDCYGTLVDWESGISAPWPGLLPPRRSEDQGRNLWKSRVDWESGISDAVALVFAHHGVRRT